MKFEVSDKVAAPFRKPRIEKGFYIGELTEIKDRKSEAQHGKQIILIFRVLDKKTNAVIRTIEGEIMEIAQVVYSEYKDLEKGGYRTAFTKNSRITKVFESLGWTFDSTKGIDTDDFIGKTAEITVDDYEAKDNDNNIYKASQIKDIQALEGETELNVQYRNSKDATGTVIETVTEDNMIRPTEEVITPEVKSVYMGLTDESKEQVKNLTNLKGEGNLSAEGFEKAMEGLIAQGLVVKQ